MINKVVTLLVSFCSLYTVSKAVETDLTYDKPPLSPFEAHALHPLFAYRDTGLQEVDVPIWSPLKTWPGFSRTHCDNVLFHWRAIVDKHKLDAKQQSSLAKLYVKFITFLANEAGYGETEAFFLLIHYLRHDSISTALPLSGVRKVIRHYRRSLFPRLGHLRLKYVNTSQLKFENMKGRYFSFARELSRRTASFYINPFVVTRLSRFSPLQQQLIYRYANRTQGMRFFNPIDAVYFWLGDGVWSKETDYPVFKRLAQRRNKQFRTMDLFLGDKYYIRDIGRIEARLDVLETLRLFEGKDEWLDSFLKSFGFILAHKHPFGCLFPFIESVFAFKATTPIVALEAINLTVQMLKIKRTYAKDAREIHLFIERQLADVFKGLQSRSNYLSTGVLKAASDVVNVCRGFVLGPRIKNVLYLIDYLTVFDDPEDYAEQIATRAAALFIEPLAIHAAELFNVYLRAEAFNKGEAFTDHERYLQFAFFVEDQCKHIRNRRVLRRHSISMDELKAL